MTFDWKQMVVKGVKYFVIFALPFLVSQFIVQFPELAQLTVGGLLVMLVNYLKVAMAVRIP